MCKIYNKLSETLFVGYKVALTDKYGHYYSPFTGIRYEKGKVKKVDANSLKTKYRTDEKIEYTEGMIGMTGVFAKHVEANYIYDYFTRHHPEYKFSLLEMTLTGDLYDAKMGDRYNTVIGNNIYKLKKIK